MTTTTTVANTTSQQQQQQQQQQQEQGKLPMNSRPPLSGTSSVASAISNASTTSTTTTTTTASATELLRSDTLIWNISHRTTNGQRLVNATVELQLSLWDGPTADADSAADDTQSELPHSMRRPLSHTNMSPALFDNLSHLFGIGQHITLTPKQSSNTSTGQLLLQNDGALQYLAQSILQRHENYDANTDTTTGTNISNLVLFQVLSGWLQTALNCAIQNCHCCIPVFGLWGNYQPHVFNKPSSRHARAIERGRGGRRGSLTVLPSWMQDTATAELPDLPLRGLRRNRQRFVEWQQIQNRSTVPSAIVGTVLPTVSTFGNFWCSFLPGCTSTSSNHTRLTQWGNILLQHCPDDTVVLWNARHVFAWWKQPVPKTVSVLEQLFQPDNYQYDHKCNPYTAWRRIGSRADDKNSTNTLPSTNKTLQPQIIIRQADDTRKALSQHQQTIVDLTGDTTPEDGTFDTMQTYYRRLEQYQTQCRALGIALLDQAAGASASEPRWGPVDDPVEAIHVTVTWDGSPASSPPSSGSKNVFPHNSQANLSKHQQPPNTISNNISAAKQPLLSFPLRIRSKQTMSPEDWVEMEESVENTILNPLQASNVQLQTWWDSETSVASLAVNQHCVLACLIRVSTLPDETLLKHITDDTVLEQWDNEAGNVVAACLAQQAQVGATTSALVNAMDWVTSAEDKMELRDAEVLVRHIMQPDNGGNFPTPPKSPLADSLESNNSTNGDSTKPNNPNNPVATPTTIRKRSLLGGASVQSRTKSPTTTAEVTANAFAPLFKSAPIGRLVSILCVHMARVRSPCSMAMLWMAFCHEVRMRWEHRIPLPHMNYVEALDPSPLKMKERNRGLGSLGVKAEHAAFWHGPPTSRSSSSDLQPDIEFPGDHHCLIGQKLQVVNLCIDMVAESEARRQQRQQERDLLEKQKRPRRGNADGTARDYYTSENHYALKKKIAEASRGVSDDMNGSEEEFVDPMSESEYLDHTRSQANQNFVDRKGARCPVPGSSLVQTGEQLYAPYFQRPYPLTDDVIAERHMMLSRHYDPVKPSPHGVHRRLEVSYRLQKPKLLSDMCAFKAANPGSIFQDFINWYGNPGNPLDDYSDTRNRQTSGATIGDLLLSRASTESVATKLDKAAEAIQMLNETREFWSRTWEEATAISASEQKLLFDVTSTVEMALDFMENMHPAILVNQVLAVNMAVSYFTIMGAAKEGGVQKIGGLIKRAFQRLRERTEQALDMLSGDATRSTSGAFNDIRRQEGSSSFISVSVISACDAACTALSEAEVLTARATSLLHKFPGQYELIDSILRHEPGRRIPLLDETGQSQILEVIQAQQAQAQAKINKGTSQSIDVKPMLGPRPALREYVLRNLDDSHPCQLSVRFADEVVVLNNSKANRGELPSRGGGLLLALTKSLVE